MTLQSMLWQVKFEEIDFVTAWITSIRVSVLFFNMCFKRREYLYFPETGNAYTLFKVHEDYITLVSTPVLRNKFSICCKITIITFYSPITIHKSDFFCKVFNFVDCGNFSLELHVLSYPHDGFTST